jgi:hypothetical protein
VAVSLSVGLEVADVFRRHGDAYRHAHEGHFGRVERRVMSAIELCRTAALGGHSEACAACGLVRCAYNCRATDETDGVDGSCPPGGMIGPSRRGQQRSAPCKG